VVTRYRLLSGCERLERGEEARTERQIQSERIRGSPQSLTSFLVIK